MRRLVIPGLFFLAGAAAMWELLRFVSSHPGRQVPLPRYPFFYDPLYDGEPREDWREQEQWETNGGA